MCYDLFYRKKDELVSKNRKKDISYDDIYGMSISEYCIAHGITVEQLISKTKTDISILKSRLKELVGDGALLCEVGKVVYDNISKKTKHLERLVEWREGNH